MDSASERELINVVEHVEEMDIVDINGKVQEIGDTETVGQNKHLKMAECMISDGTAQLKLVLWEGHIAMVEKSKVYSFSQVRVRVKDEGKMLNTTIDTVIKLDNN